MSQGNSVSTDLEGNVYCSGIFGDSIDLDPTSGVNVFYGFPTNHHSFVQKFDNAGNFLWARGCPGQMKTMLSDSSGNIYIAGRFNGSIDFDLGPGVTSANSSLGIDLYVIKYDSTGVFKWVYSIGNNSNLYPAGMEFDAQNNLVVLASFQDSVDLDPGPNVNMITALDYEDPFLMKLDTAGNFMWGNRIGGRVSSAIFIQMDIDQQSNIIVTGSFNTVEDFGQLTPNVFTPQGADVHIQKFDSGGNLLWAKFISSPLTQGVTALELDAENNMYIAGNYYGTTDFDPSPNVFNLPIESSNSDVFLLKLNENAEFQWVKNLHGSSSSGYLYNIQSSRFADTIFLTGWTTGYYNQFDLNFGDGIALLPDDKCSYLLAIDSTSEYLWSKPFFTDNNDNILDLHLSADKSLYLSGGFSNQVDFDPSPNQELLNSPTAYSHFLLKLGNCNPEYTLVTETKCDEYYANDSLIYYNNSGFYSITIPRSFNCDSVILLSLNIINSSYNNDTIIACNNYTWIDGNTYTSSNNSATHTLTNAEGCDSIITLNLTINNPTTSTDSISACNTYTWIDGNTYTASNNSATHTLTTVEGCDSVITLNLTINNPTTSTDSISACNTYMWIDGNTYIASNNSATYTLTSALGCDSLVTLDLTILNPSTGIDVQTACNSYTWIDGNTYTSSNNYAIYTLTNAVGCDSVVTLDLTINNSSTETDIQTACESFTWIDGNTYTSSNNTANFTLTNSTGCDSVVTLDLTINNVNANTTLNGVTVTSDAVGASYQWLNCDNGMTIISGETNQSFIATSNGNYAVIVGENGCIDTSSCVEITTIGILENTLSDHFKVAPNPTNGKFTIEFDKIQMNLSVQLLSVSGQIVQNYRFQDTSLIELELNQPDGFYFLELKDGNGKRATLRIVKE